jgi:hypothetical protein
MNKYIYSFNYENTERDLCMLESVSIFDKEVRSKLLFSDREIEPSTSTFIKSRLAVISFSTDYTALITQKHLTM